MQTIQHKVHSRVTTEALAAVLVAACTFLAGPVQAQESKIKRLEPAQSSIQGVVTAIGPEGQSTPLEGIPLKLSDGYLEAQSLSTLTDAEGHYEFTQLGAGTYSLEITVEGFKPFEAEIGQGHLFGGHNTIGNIFYGSKGYLATGDEDASSYKTWLGHGQESGPKGHAGGDHFANFIDCVRSRKKENLNAPIEEGHISCCLVHLANVSYRLGRSLRFDPETLQAIGDEEANHLLRDRDRGYRAPFVVPKEV